VYIYSIKELWRWTSSHIFLKKKNSKFWGNKFFLKSFPKRSKIKIFWNDAKTSQELTKPLKMLCVVEKYLEFKFLKIVFSWCCRFEWKMFFEACVWWSYGNWPKFYLPNDNLSKKFMVHCFKLISTRWGWYKRVIHKHSKYFNKSTTTKTFKKLCIVVKYL